MPKIEANDSIEDVLVKLSEGNPGALSVIVQIIKQANKINPACNFTIYLLILDTLKIHGSKIWMLYKDVCDQNLINTLGILMAYQLGNISELELKAAINNYGKNINIEDIMGFVRTQVPDFTKKITMKELTSD